MLQEPLPSPMILMLLLLLPLPSPVILRLEVVFKTQAGDLEHAKQILTQLRGGPIVVLDQ